MFHVIKSFSHLQDIFSHSVFLDILAPIFDPKWYAALNQNPARTHPANPYGILQLLKHLNTLN